MKPLIPTAIVVYRFQNSPDSHVMLQATAHEAPGTQLPSDKARRLALSAALCAETLSLSP